jgi:hypothetical protein
MNTNTVRSMVAGPLMVFAGAFIAAILLLLSPAASRAAGLAALAGQLGIGSQGASVTTLQTLLATDPNAYPQGLVTGYYGPLTEKAVANFQIGYGLPGVGNVGPRTLALINQLIANGNTSIDITAPLVSNMQVATTPTTATITWSTNEQVAGSVHYDVVPIVSQEVSTAHQDPQTSGTLIREQTMGQSHSLTITGLLANHTYYFSTESRDVTGNVTVTRSQSFATQG